MCWIWKIKRNNINNNKLKEFILTKEYNITYEEHSYYKKYIIKKKLKILILTLKIGMNLISD